MSIKSFKRGDREFSFFTNFWSFAQAYWENEKSEEYHAEVLAGCDKLLKTFCCDKDGKLLDDISSLRMAAIIRAFAFIEERNFMIDFMEFTERFSEAKTDEEWKSFVSEGNGLISKYCTDDSWRSRRRERMVTDYLFNVDEELQRRREKG